MEQLSSEELSGVVNRLCSSFEVQCTCYTQLDVITRRAAGALAMSRGDFTEVLSVFSEKEKLIAQIVSSKELVANDILLWQEHKASAPDNLAGRLERYLDKIELVVKRFLAAEKQLEKQISFYQKGN